MNMQNPLVAALMGEYSTLGGSKPPRSAEYTRAMAQALSQSARDTSPVDHPIQGIARIADGFFAGRAQDRADEQSAIEKAQQSAAISGFLQKQGVDLAGVDLANLPQGAVSGLFASALKGPDKISSSDLVQTVGPDGQPVYTPATDAVGQPAYQKGGNSKYVNLYNPRSPNDPPVTVPEGSEQFMQALERGYVIGGDYKTPDAPQSGFAGNGMPAQEANALMQFTQLSRAGRPIPQELRMMAQWAYERNSQERIQTMPDGSTVMIPAMDLSAFANPFGGQAQPVSGQPQPDQAMPQQAAAHPYPQSIPAGATMITPPKDVIEARNSIPKIRDETANMIRLVDSLIKHPGMPSVVGMPTFNAESVFGGMTGLYPSGSKEADFMARLDQIGGQQFLQAFEGLKGGGQITEVEGKKATEAMSRLTMIGQSEEAYREAAEDLKSVLKRAAARAYEKAGVPVPPQFGGRMTSEDDPLGIMGTQAKEADPLGLFKGRAGPDRSSGGLVR
jgi:hypothetical protein